MAANGNTPLSRASVIVVAAIISLAVSPPARADMLYLGCRYQYADHDYELDIDLTNKTVTDGNGVYAATISTTSIAYKIDFNGGIYDYLIDRAKGTITRFWSAPGTIRQVADIVDCHVRKTHSPTKF
jgi:hypothetical protein